MDVGTYVEQQIAVAVAALKRVACADSRAAHALRVLESDLPMKSRSEMAGQWAVDENARQD
jgi:hypothetical protein